MKFLSRIDKIIARIESGLLIFILLFMVVLAFGQVILRNVFDTSLAWGDILIRHLVLWIGLIGASLGTRENRHISIDAVSRIIPRSYKRILSVFVNLISCAICFILIFASYTFISYEKMSDSTIFGSVPTWTALIIIPAAFFFIAFRFFLAVLFTLFSESKGEST